ncbi:MAG: guanylate kinase [Candidatus Zixiibacteriota bacterium]|nr:MAG: guanylate kinase [candidate division Zixibacteria bacterium]
MKRTPGTIIVISSPSGGGKTSICRKLLTPARKRKGWRFSISYTTRARRPGERNGREYYFVTENEFKKLVRRRFFAEHFKVHLYRYGTPRRQLEQVLKGGGVMILDVDVQGAFRIKKEYPQAVTIFILPPSIPVLRKRLIRRGTETREQRRVRFENARKEIALYRKFQYCVINDDLDTAVKEVLSIIDCHHCRTENIKPEQIRKLLV